MSNVVEYQLLGSFTYINIYISKIKTILNNKGLINVTLFIHDLHAILLA
jgi:hypothetical protein